MINLWAAPRPGWVRGCDVCIYIYILYYIIFIYMYIYIYIYIYIYTNIYIYANIYIYTNIYIYIYMCVYRSITKRLYMYSNHIHILCFVQVLQVLIYTWSTNAAGALAHWLKTTSLDRWYVFREPWQLLSYRGVYETPSLISNNAKGWQSAVKWSKLQYTIIMVVYPY